MGPDIVVPFILFGFLGAVILVPIWLKEKTKQSAHKLISQALDKGQALDPEIMRELTSGKRQEADRPRRTLGNGVVLMALGLAFVAAVYIGGGPDEMLIPALILGALGLAFTGLAIVDYQAKKKDQ